MDAAGEKMRPALGAFAVALAIALLLALVVWPGGSREARAQQTRPNIMFVYTDDQDEELFRREFMPRTFANLVDAGSHFENHYGSTPLCCPTRVTYLRGQYSHNTRVLSNEFPSGGYRKYRNLGYRDWSLPRWLGDAGYFTGHFGRVMNGYDDFAPEPSGPWDRFVALTKESHPSEFRIHDDGRTYDVSRSRQESVDHLRGKVIGFVDDRARSAAPFYAHVSFFEPHSPYHYPDRYQGYYGSLRLPENPNFNEADVGDKPWFVRERSPYTQERKEQLTRYYRARARGVRAVDDAVGDIIAKLKREGEYRNTVFIFTSDNGYDLGNRRTVGKIDAYEESSSVPLAMAGPGIARAKTVTGLSSTNDIVPTISDLADSGQKAFFDGRSLTPLVDGGPPPPWRTAVGIEYLPLSGDEDPRHQAYSAIRTEGNELYVEHRNGEREYYDMDSDPYQLENAADDPANRQRISELSGRVADLKTCAGAGCRAAEDGR